MESVTEGAKASKGTMAPAAKREKKKTRKLGLLISSDLDNLAGPKLTMTSSVGPSRDGLADLKSLFSEMDSAKRPKLDANKAVSPTKD